MADEYGESPGLGFLGLNAIEIRVICDSRLNSSGNATSIPADCLRAKAQPSDFDGCWTTIPVNDRRINHLFCDYSQVISPDVLPEETHRYRAVRSAPTSLLTFRCAGRT